MDTVIQFMVIIHDKSREKIEERLIVQLTRGQKPKNSFYTEKANIEDFGIVEEYVKSKFGLFTRYEIRELSKFDKELENFDTLWESRIKLTGI